MDYREKEPGSAQRQSDNKNVGKKYVTTYIKIFKGEGMNSFKNISDKKKSFLISLINDFFEAFIIIIGISYISIITILSKIGIINFFGAEYWGLSVIVATFGFPLLLLILLLIIYAIEEIVTAIPLAIHKIKAIYNYTYYHLLLMKLRTL